MGQVRNLFREGDPPAHAQQSQSSSSPGVNLLSTLRCSQSTALNLSPFQLLGNKKCAMMGRTKEREQGTEAAAGDQDYGR